MRMGSIIVVIIVILLLVHFWGRITGIGSRIGGSHTGDGGNGNQFSNPSTLGGKQCGCD